MNRLNMRLIALFAAALAPAAMASPILSVGHVEVTLNGSAAIPIWVLDSGSAALQDIEGMQFSIQIGDGSGLTPSITSIDMLTGTIWSGHASLVFTPAGGSEPQFASRAIITGEPGDFVNANGLLATVVIDAHGAALGSYELSLVNLSFAGSDTEFQNGLGEPVDAAIANGTLSVVPTPTALGGLALLPLLWILRRVSPRKA